MCLASKTVRHKLYNDLQSLFILIYCWKYLLIDFITGLLILTAQNRDNYDLILIIINRLTKIIYYKLVKVTIDAPSFRKVIINVVVKHYGFANSIMTDRKLLFILKIWLLLFYFLDIKQKPFIASQLQTNSITERQNSIIETYIWAYVNFEQNDGIRFLLLAEIVSNNAKNANTGHTSFEFNCGYYLYIFMKKISILA